MTKTEEKKIAEDRVNRLRENDIVWVVSPFVQFDEPIKGLFLGKKSRLSVKYMDEKKASVAYAYVDEVFDSYAPAKLVCLSRLEPPLLECIEGLEQEAIYLQERMEENKEELREETRILEAIRKEIAKLTEKTKRDN